MLVLLLPGVIWLPAPRAVGPVLVRISYEQAAVGRKLQWVAVGILPDGRKGRFHLSLRGADLRAGNVICVHAATEGAGSGLALRPLPEARCGAPLPTGVSPAYRAM